MSHVKEYVLTILYAILIAAFIMTFVAQSFVVEGASMEPTLHSGERILIEKVGYRFRNPARGDVIVLKSPSVRPFVKRIIGIAGDTILICDGRVYLNDKVLEEPYIKEVTAGNWGPYVVPDGTVFVLGDNRNNSNDSRITVGYLDIKDIKGRAVLVFYPLNRAQIL